MEGFDGASGHEVPQAEIENLAGQLIDLIPLLRYMSAANDDSWMRLYLRIMEIGGMTPFETSVLKQIVDGLEPDFGSDA
jgi:hypothetical protein